MLDLLLDTFSTKESNTTLRNMKDGEVGRSTHLKSYRSSNCRYASEVEHTTAGKLGKLFVADESCSSLSTAVSTLGSSKIMLLKHRNVDNPFLLRPPPTILR